MGKQRARKRRAESQAEDEQPDTPREEVHVSCENCQREIVVQPRRMRCKFCGFRQPDNVLDEAN